MKIPGLKILIVLLFIGTSTFGQKSPYNHHLDLDQKYLKAVELFENKKYASAQKLFAESEELSNKLVGDEIYNYKVNAAYYQAICAMELFNGDAESQLLNFINDHQGSPKSAMASFYLGKYYFRTKKYKDAITWFKKVEQRDLSKEERYEYRFQLAYSLFNRKSLKEAEALFAQLKDQQGKYYNPSNYYYGFIKFYNGEYDKALKSFEIVKDVDEYERVVPYYLCQINYGKGKYDEVIEYGEAQIDKPRAKYKTDINQLVGQSYFQKKQYGDALPYLTYYAAKARKVRKEDYYQLAFTQYQAGEYENAIKNFKELNYQTDSLGQSALYILAECYIKTGQKEKARNAFMESAKLKFDQDLHENALFNYGKLSYELNFYKIAVSTLGDFIKQFPISSNKVEAQELLAESLLHTRNYKDAISVIESINPKSQKVKTAYQKVTYYHGVELVNNRDPKNARVYFNKSLQNNIDVGIQASANYWLGEISYRENNFDQAINYHSRFLDLAKLGGKIDPPANSNTANYTLGYCYLNKEQYKEALTYFKRVSQVLKPGNPDLVFDRIAKDAIIREADCSFMAKDYRTASTNYQTIISNKYPGADYAIYQKGMILGLEGKLNDKASTLQNLISKYPKSLYNDDALYEIGNSHFVLGNNQSAIATFKKLVSEKPNSAYAGKAKLKLGLIYYNLGNNKEATKYYQEIAEKNPGTQESMEAIKGIKDISIEQGNPELYTEMSGVSISEKDSITYLAAETKYKESNCEAAIPAFGRYIKEFRKGYFKNQAHFYRAECLYKNQEFVDALEDYEFVIESGLQQFMELSLLKAARICYFKVEDYHKAIEYYQSVYEFAEYKDNSFEALKGILRSNYKLGNHPDVIRYAQDMISNEESSVDDLIEANYYAGKSQLSRKNLTEAYKFFKSTRALTTNEQGVEAAFQMAMIEFKQDRLEESKESCLRIINETPTYAEYVIKSYILISDILVEEGEYIQARASLSSIVDNYTGDPALVEIARKKLKEIESKERSKSKIYDDSEEDEIEMDESEIIEIVQPR